VFLNQAVFALMFFVVGWKRFFAGVNGEVSRLGREADFKNVGPFVFGDEVGEGEEVLRVARDRENFDGLIGVGFLEVRALPPKRTGLPSALMSPIEAPLVRYWSLSWIFLKKIPVFGASRATSEEENGNGFH